MSFGWSIGDILAGIKIVWNVYEAVSDGPRNARLEATQFFQEFNLIVQCLNDWEQRSAAALSEDISLKGAHEALCEQCNKFIKRHMFLIQEVNPKTTAARNGHTWLSRAAFTREQVSSLYSQVKWPFEREEVKTLRAKLELFIDLATYRVSASTHSAVQQTNEMVRQMRLVFRCVLCEKCSY